MRVLARGVECVVARTGIEVADSCARLDGIRDEPVVDEIDLSHMGGAGKGRVRCRLIAKLPIEAKIVRRFARALPRRRP